MASVCCWSTSIRRVTARWEAVSTSARCPPRLQVLLGMADVRTARQHAEHGGYDVLGANRELAGAEIDLVDLEHRETRLKDALAAVNDQYEFILIDCPPSLSLLTLNGLCAAHGVIIPMQCEYFALEGSPIWSILQRVAAHLNPDLRIIGLLRVMSMRA